MNQLTSCCQNPVEAEGLLALSTVELAALIVGTLALILAARLAWQYWRAHQRRQPHAPDSTVPESTSSFHTQPMQHLLQMMEVRKEMNPLTEAEVYLAFGRDRDAEALMLEAIRKSPMKLGYRIKLAEIYAQRRDAVSFQITAAKLKLMTEASGPVWAHICEIGQRIDPRNPDYQVVHAPTAESHAFVERHLDGGMPAFPDTQPASMLDWPGTNDRRGPRAPAH